MSKICKFESFAELILRELYRIYFAYKIISNINLYYFKLMLFIIKI